MAMAWGVKEADEREPVSYVQASSEGSSLYTKPARDEAAIWIRPVGAARASSCTGSSR
ncbi:hypothetical protein MY11210_001091 [Beauveria gryllotalpidicola]